MASTSELAHRSARSTSSTPRAAASSAVVKGSKARTVRTPSPVTMEAYSRPVRDRPTMPIDRSEERRVGKEWRSRGWREQEKKEVGREAEVNNGIDLDRDEEQTGAENRWWKMITV